MNGKTIETLSHDELLGVAKRDRFVKEQLTARVGNLIQENIELLAIIQDLQAEVRDLRSVSNGEVEAEITPAHEHDHVTS